LPPIWPCSSQLDEWKKAMKEEFEALKKTGTFELVPLPKGKKTIGARWLFKMKCRTNGTINLLTGWVPLHLPPQPWRGVGCSTVVFC